MRYSKRIKKEKGKSEQETSFEFDWKVQLGLIFLFVLLVLLYHGREFIIPFFEFSKYAIK